jgi:hypothetical protein
LVALFEQAIADHPLSLFFAPAAAVNISKCVESLLASITTAPIDKVGNGWKTFWPRRYPRIEIPESKFP